MAVGDRSGTARPWVAERGGIPTVTIADQYLGIVAEEIGLSHLALVGAAVALAGG